jgi:[ribosomal protein S5]-alanine N-acetyltransferase
MKLIPYQPSFLNSFVEWRSQPLSTRHNPLLAMTTAEIARILESEGSDLGDLQKYQSYRWFVEDDGAMLGTVSLKNISHTMGYAEIGYAVGAAHQRKGVATLAVSLLVERCFRESPLRKLLAYVNEKNVASCRVLQKVGFTQEGFLREHYIINGAPENEILFGLLKREWQRSEGATLGGK